MKICKKGIILMEGDFFQDFIDQLGTFLIEIEDKYNKRFGDLELKNNDDKILFEYFLLFLGNSNFSENLSTLTEMCNEFSIPLSDNELEERLVSIKKPHE